MSDIVMYLIPICVVGFLVLGTYKTFELFARRKERELLIEKLSLLAENKEDDKNRLKIRLPFIGDGDSGFGFWPLRISLLLIGIGAGCLVAFFIRINSGSDLSWDLTSLINVASILMFGGIGLLIAYFIEQRKRMKKEDEKL